MVCKCVAMCNSHLTWLCSFVAMLTSEVKFLDCRLSCAVLILTLVVAQGCAWCVCVCVCVCDDGKWEIGVFTANVAEMS